MKKCIPSDNKIYFPHKDANSIRYGTLFFKYIFLIKQKLEAINNKDKFAIAERPDKIAKNMILIFLIMVYGIYLTILILNYELITIVFLKKNNFVKYINLFNDSKLFCFQYKTIEGCSLCTKLNIYNIQRFIFK